MVEEKGSKGPPEEEEDCGYNHRDERYERELRGFGSGSKGNLRTTAGPHGVYGGV